MKNESLLLTVALHRSYCSARQGPFVLYQYSIMICIWC